MNSFSGNDGCNVINGKVIVENDAISFRNIIRTQMACENMEDGAVFVNNLMTINRYEINGGELLLYKDKQLIMTLESLR
jgi:heat shock protein HslJ